MQYDLSVLKTGKQSIDIFLKVEDDYELLTNMQMPDIVDLVYARDEYPFAFRIFRCELASKLEHLNDRIREKGLYFEEDNTYIFQLHRDFHSRPFRSLKLADP